MKSCQEKILILHGWGSCGKNWDQVKKLLENQGYKVIVPDLPGFGQSLPPKTSWSINNYVEWVKNFCEENNLSNIILLGHSFGGRIAIKFAIKYPEKIQKLILNSAAGITPRPKIKISIFCFLSKIVNLIFSLPALKFLRPLAQKIAYRFGMGRDYQMIQNSVMRETFKKVIGENLTSYLSQITLPCLIVWGDKDKMTPISDAYKMKKEIPNSQLEIIPKVGHVACLEAPEILAEKILNYLKQ